jgi:hypothetical protein
VNAFTQLWTVKMSDWQRALVIAVLSGPFGILYDSVMAWSFTFDWKAIVRAAVTGFFAYYGKNFITGINGNILTNSPKSIMTGGVDIPKVDTPK